MREGLPGGRSALLAALLAAFFWAAYYGFVLGLRGAVSPVAVITYPFLIGGAAFLARSAYRGELAAWVPLLVSPAQWARVLMFWGAQVGIVLLTLESAAVDASLLSLVGDAVATPLLVLVLFREGPERLRSPLFLAGLVLSTGGASLTILAGGALEPLSGLSIAVAPLVPVLVAGFYTGTARAARRAPVDALVGQAALAAAALGVPLALVLPAASGSLALPGPTAFGLLAATGLVSFFVAPRLFFAAIDRAGILLPALLMATIPIFTLGIAALLSGSVPPPLGLAGVPVAVVGAVLAVEGVAGRPGPPAGGGSPDPGRLTGRRPPRRRIPGASIVGGAGRAGRRGSANRARWRPAAGPRGRPGDPPRSP